MVKLKQFQIKWLGLIAGVVSLLLIIAFVNFGPNQNNAKIVAGVATLMAVWWITEAIPLAATALIPLILFPAFGIVSGAQTSQAYANSTIFLFLGGFIIAIAIEQWNLHKRIAFKVIDLFGTHPSRIVLGFMCASAFISMWINNTSTTLMILPIGMAVILKVEEEFGKDRTKLLGKAILLGIAYASSIGGISTIVGTAPNMVFQRTFKITFPNNPEIHFGEWMKFALPIAVIMLVTAWFLITKVFYKMERNLQIQKKVLHEEKAKLGKMTYEEKVVSLVFITTCILWIFRENLDLEFILIPGWTNIFPNGKFIDDGTIAVAMALLLFLIPAQKKTEEEFFILNFSALKKIPWDIIILFGGGFALADGFVTSGLSKLIGQQLASFSNVHPVLLIFIVCASVTFISELASNTATVQIVLPILAALSIQLNINPILLMFPATLAASFGFMLPVGTPPNAIVFGTQRLKVIDMVKTGVLIDFISVVVITLFMWLFFF